MSLSTVWRRLLNRRRRNSRLSSFAACARVHCYGALHVPTKWRSWWCSSAVRYPRPRMALPSEPMAVLCARFSERDYAQSMRARVGTAALGCPSEQLAGGLILGECRGFAPTDSRGRPSLRSALSPSQREFHFHLLPLLLARPEHLPRLQFHRPRQEDIGELCDPRVVGGDVVVEKLAAVGDSLLQFGDAILQHQKILVGLELRISLRHHKKRSQGARQQQVCLGLLWNTGRVHRSRTGLRHRLQRVPLIVHVALDACHQVG